MGNSVMIFRMVQPDKCIVYDIRTYNFVPNLHRKRPKPAVWGEILRVFVDSNSDIFCASATAVMYVISFYISGRLI